MSSIQAYEACDEVDGCEEVSRGFVVARCDCPELLELAEEILDEVPRLVEFLVVVALYRPITPGRDYRDLVAAASSSITRASASKALSASKVPTARSGKKASAPRRSCACPGVSRKLTGLPRASTKAWILVLSPPLLRAIAWSASFFLEHRRCADGHARWCCRSSRIHCRHLRSEFVIFCWCGRYEFDSVFRVGDLDDR